MPIVPNFTVSQTPGQPSVINITDTSTGSDVAITQRRVYLRKYNGTFLVPSNITTEYIPWSYLESSISIDALDKDYALDIIVEWLNVSNVILYSKDSVEGTNCYNEDFDYLLTQMLTANPPLTNDNDFQKNKFKLRSYIDSGDQAIVRIGDIYAGQLCYDLATRLRLNSQYYFNVNS